MFDQRFTPNEFEKLYIEQEDNSYLKTFCNELSSGIVKTQWTILNIVESLKDFLTSTDLGRHNFGLHVLRQVVEFLPLNLLMEKEVEFITDFFCGQIKQHHSFITAALKGINCLVKNPNLPKYSLHNVTSTLFNTVVWQTQTLTDRMVFYEILQYIVFNRLEDFKTVSSEFLFNIVSSVDGERDPRNLLLLFSFVPKLYTEIPLGTLTEDAFEVVSCYFPIDFHSQSSEPGSVSREDLVSALNPCLLAHPDFAALCLPMILEKLESSLKSAKIDSYNLLVEASNVWPTHIIGPYLKALWQLVKSDVLPPRDTQTAEAALRALQAIVKTAEEPHLSSALSTIMSSCEVFLSDIQLSMFEPSFRLLSSLMQTNLTICLSLSQKLFQKLIDLLKVTQDEAQRDVILAKMTAFLQICFKMNPNFDFGREAWQEVLALPDMSPQAYATLSLAVTQLDIRCRIKLYEKIVSHLTSTSTPSLRTSCIKCLQEMAMLYDDEVEEHVLKKILIEDEKVLTQVQLRFEIVCAIGIVEKFHPTLDCLLRDLISRGGPYLTLTILCIRNILEMSDSKFSEKLFKFLFSQSSLIPSLISAQVEGNNLLHSATIVRILVGCQEPRDQETCVPSYVNEVLQHNNQTQKMVFLEALVTPLWPQVTVLTPEEVRIHILPVALDYFEDELARNSALQLLAVGVNRSTDDSLLEFVSQSILSCTEENQPTVCAYITKALVLRSHPIMEVWIDKLLELLNSKNEAVAKGAAEGFHLIVQESATTHSHWVIRLLYRQRLFHIVVPHLVKSAGKLQHLQALAYLLQAVPYTVYMNYIKEILPLLVKSLDVDNEGLLLTVLNTLSHLLSDKLDLLQDYVDTFIPRFLHLSRQSLFMQVRIASLKCLSSVLKFSSILLLPHKQQVIAGLVHCLDDRKRLVRKEAARTRSKWCLLGAPIPD